MEDILIKLDKLLKSGLNSFEYILLQMIYERNDWQDFADQCPECSRDTFLKLERLGYIKLLNGEVINRIKLEELFKDDDVDIDQVKYVFDQFKEITGKTKLRYVEANKKFIRARLNEGYSFEDLVLVARDKYNEWKSDPKMRQYIRISTLYNAEKFQGYIDSAHEKLESSDNYIDRM